MADRLTRNELTDTLKFTKHVAHALSIDEQRHQFVPNRLKFSKDANDFINGRTCSEQWCVNNLSIHQAALAHNVRRFAGVHSDV